MLKKQKGLALVTTLLLLLVVTLIAVSGMQTSLVQEKMVSATRDSQLSFEGAEYALRAAEEVIEGFVTVGGFDDSGCLYSSGVVAVGNSDFVERNPFDANLWSSSQSCVVNISDSDLQNLGLAEAPRYYIELMETFGSDNAGSLNIQNYGGSQAANDITGFKIVVRSTGATGRSQSILMEYYGKAI